MNQRVCDRCKAVIDSKTAPIWAELRVHSPGGGSNRDLDLCQPCYQAFMRYLTRAEES